MICGVSFQSFFADLFAHQAWADASLLSAVKAHPPLQQDEWLQKTLLHVVGVQRYFLSLFLDRPFDRAWESQAPASFGDLVTLYRNTHHEELGFIGGLPEAGLDRRFLLPFLKTEFTVADGLTQIVMHSQNHRGQCLRYMRKHGGEPPTLDYILWAKDRPGPVWPVV
jgi:uncharacterized damage-inducible protein DinB